MKKKYIFALCSSLLFLFVILFSFVGESHFLQGRFSAIPTVPDLSFSADLSAVEEAIDDGFYVCRQSKSVHTGTVVYSRAAFFNYAKYSGSYDFIVDDNSSYADFASIQDAVNASASGYRIGVCPGDYQENVFINRSLNLIGLSDPEYIVVDGSADSYPVVETGSASLGLALVNMTLENGNTTYGGGISNQYADLVLDNLLIQNNSAVEKGAGVYHKDNDLRMNEVRIQSNEVLGHGGGLYTSNANVEVSNSDFSNNLAAVSGGGFYIGDSVISPKSFSIERSEFYLNEGVAGGAIYVDSGNTVEIEESNLFENLAYNPSSWSMGGAIYIHDDGDLIVRDSNFWENLSKKGHGGAIVASGHGLKVYDSAFIKNEADKGQGGAIYSDRPTAQINISGSDFIENAAYYSGGAIDNVSGVFEISESLFDSNSVSYGSAGAIGNADEMTIKDNTQIINNIATHSGGAINNSDSSLTTSDLKIFNSTIEGNQPGAIYNRHNLYVENSSIIRNKGNAEAIDTYAYSSNVSVNTLVNSTVSENEAAGIAGAGSHEFYLTNMTITQNGYQGFGMNEKTTVEMKNTIIVDNGVATSSGSGLDCWTVNGHAITSHGNNIVTSNTTGLPTSNCVLSPVGSSTPLDYDVSPNLGVLQNNGGYTETHLPASGSIAIDLVDMLHCSDIAGNPLTHDQRYMSRPQGIMCDAGAVEQ